MRLRAFLQGVADDHGTASAKAVKSVVSNVLNLAIENGVLPVNAMRAIRPVKSQSPTHTVRDHTRALSDDQRTALMICADKAARQPTLDPRAQRKREAVADLVAFMAGTGVRIGEARNLRWVHVDLDGGYVRLHGTKSLGARRRIDLPTWLTERLASRLAQQAAHLRYASKHAKGTSQVERGQVVAQLLASAETVGTDGLVFPSPARLDINRSSDESNAAHAVREILDASGLEWAVPHSLRRTVATRLAEKGVPLAQIADQLGHADPSMTASVYLGRDFEGDKSAIAAHL